MAAVYEIIRQKKRGLHLYAHSNGQGVDELIGGGCVDRLEIAYGGSGRFASTCIRFRKAVESGRLAVEDYTNYQMTLRFMAGAMGVPFLPTRSSLGSDIVNRWGFSEADAQGRAARARQQTGRHGQPLRRAGAIRTGWSWCRPSIRTSPSFMCRPPTDRGPPASTACPLPTWSRPRPPDTLIVTCETLVRRRPVARGAGKEPDPFFLRGCRGACRLWGPGPPPATGITTMTRPACTNTGNAALDDESLPGYIWTRTSWHPRGIMRR